MRKYIDELNIDFEDTPQGSYYREYEDIDSLRSKKWHQEQKIYGFDEREIWSLDYSLKLWLYERLKMYNERNTIDTSYHKFIYNNEKLTQQQCIDKMLEGLKLDLTLNDYDPKRIEDSEIKTKIEDVFPILSLCINSLWY